MRNLFTFLTLSFLLLAIDFFGWLGPVRAGVEKGSNPLKLSLHRAMSNVKCQMSNVRYSREELMELKKRTEELERESSKLEARSLRLEAENEAMRRLLQAPLPAEWKFLPAQVLGRTRYLSIDKGKRDGVKKGLVAIFENILVGRVVEVSEKSAKIILASDPESKITVRTGNVRGILVGEGERLILTQVLQKQTLEVGNLVVTAGENEIFPPNLLIAKIKAIEKEERQPYQKAAVEPLVEYDQLETVFLIID